MQLSESENTEFNKMTAGFELSDLSALKKMEKKDKASAMSFVSLPYLEFLPLAGALIALLFAIGAKITGNDAQLFTACAVAIMFVMLSLLVTPRRKATSEVAKPE